MSDFDSAGIQWKWVLVSMGVFLVANIVLGIAFFFVGILTLGLGFIIGIFVFKPLVYFIGGYITGILSPGVTIKEPAIGALAMVLLGTIFQSAQHKGSLIWIIISGAIAFFFALWGAQLGESK